MPKKFNKNDSGGWSFLALCMDKNGEIWGEHESVEELICLGIAIGMVGYSTPREMWSILPGGMPYIWIDTSASSFFPSILY